MVEQSSTEILTIKSLSRQFDSPAGIIHILQDVTLKIDSGESVAITGVSGSGKTTLLGLMAGMDLPTQGQIIVDGHEITALTEDERAQLRGRIMGFVFQSFHLLPFMTALENVMLPLELQQQQDAEAIAKQVLARVGLEKRVDHYPRQLSGGELQRVAIARAYATQPRILFADEPTGNLDSKTGDKITDLLMGMNDEWNTTLIIVTHDTQMAQRCGRVISLVDGRLEQ